MPLTPGPASGPQEEVFRPEGGTLQLPLSGCSDHAHLTTPLTLSDLSGRTGSSHPVGAAYYCEGSAFPL